jgi:hypothetical protein
VQLPAPDGGHQPHLLDHLTGDPADVDGLTAGPRCGCQFDDGRAEPVPVQPVGQGRSDLPGFRALALPDGFDFDFDLDQLFEFGLELVLDGLAVKLQRARTTLR